MLLNMVSLIEDLFEMRYEKCVQDDKAPSDIEGGKSRPEVLTWILFKHEVNKHHAPADLHDKFLSAKYQV